MAPGAAETAQAFLASGPSGAALLALPWSAACSAAQNKAGLTPKRDPQRDAWPFSLHPRTGPPAPQGARASPSELKHCGGERVRLSRPQLGLVLEASRGHCRKLDRRRRQSARAASIPGGGGCTGVSGVGTHEPRRCPRVAPRTRGLVHIALCFLDTWKQIGCSVFCEGLVKAWNRVLVAHEELK